MKAKKIFGSIIFIILVGVGLGMAQSPNVKTIIIESQDQVNITADLYLTDQLVNPFVILFHQAGYSRGEYMEIGPKLNALGFNCMAIDQRSGKAVNGVLNETYKFAKSKANGTSYPDAYPDLEAAMRYITKNFQPTKLLVWGSSYSSSLVFIMAAKNEQIDGVLSFSPGEYFKFEGKGIAEWAKLVNCPVFVTSSQEEGEACSKIFNNAKNPKNVQFVPSTKGFHGSKALWESNQGHDEYWKAVIQFLETFQ